MIAGARVEVAPYKRDPGRFRAVEAEQRRAARLGQPVGPRPPRLAHRMLGDDRGASRRDDRHPRRRPRPRSSRTTRMRSRSAAAATAARRLPATGCTTASSTWARRRCRRARQCRARSTNCSTQGTRARCCGWPCCRRITASRSWTDSLIAQSQGDARPAVSRRRRCGAGRGRSGRGRGAERRSEHAAGARAAVARSTIRRSLQGQRARCSACSGDSADAWFQGGGDARHRRPHRRARAEAKARRDFADRRPHPRRAAGGGHLLEDGPRRHDLAAVVNAPLYTIEILRLAASLPDPATLDRASTGARSSARRPAAARADRGADGWRARRRSVADGARLRVRAGVRGAGRASTPSGGPATRSPSALAALTAWLDGKARRPRRLAGLAALAPARSRKSRHGAIVLPFRALLAAIEEAAA